MSLSFIRGLRALGAALGLSLLAAAAPAAPTLQPYASDTELREALTRWHTAAEALRQSSRRERMAAGDVAVMASPMAMSAAPAPAPAPAPAGESITNVQTAGVDEGGIVKRAGDFLVILRRGRLFTVRVGGDRLQPVHQGPAYGPGIDPRGAWYDELLVSGRSVVVVGYSYARGGTEIGLFDLGDDGRLTYRSTHHLRSQDYFSARNYASRLIGTRLVFYTPFVISPWQASPWETQPGLRRWQGDASASAPFERLLPATRIYRTDDEFDPCETLALHTVTTCELAAAPLRCASSAVLGPVGRVFYVSAGSVYVWTTTQRRADSRTAAATSAVFRLPLDPAAGAPTALKTVGVPIDQLSFLEGDDGWLPERAAATAGCGRGLAVDRRAAGAAAAADARVGAGHARSARETDDNVAGAAARAAVGAGRWQGGGGADALPDAAAMGRHGGAEPPRRRLAAVGWRRGRGTGTAACRPDGRGGDTATRPPRRAHRGDGSACAAGRVDRGGPAVHRGAPGSDSGRAGRPPPPARARHARTASSSAPIQAPLATPTPAGLACR